MTGTVQRPVARVRTEPPTREGSIERTLDRRLVWLALVLAVVPVLSVRVAPLCDFPNHLARVHVLAATQADASWANYYSLGDWVLPNLALDAFATPVALFVGSELAGTAFLLGLTLLTVFGAMRIARAHERSEGIAGLLTVSAMYSISFAYGLVNYAFGLALLVFGLGVWIGHRQSSPLKRIAISVPIALALFFSHLMAFAFYALAIATYEMVDLWKPKTRGSVASHVVAAGVQFVVPAILFLGFSPTRGEAGGWTALPWSKKLDQLGSVFLLGGPSATSDLVFTGLFAAVVVFLVVAARGRMRPSGIALLGMFALLFVIAPQRTATADNISLRVPTAIALLFAAFFEVRAPEGSRGHRIAVALLATLAVGRTVQVTAKWVAEAPTYEAILITAERVPSDATVFTLRDAHHRDQIRQTWHPPLAHAACLVALRERVYLPQLFANEAQQPLVVRSGPLRKLRYLRDDFLPTYRSADEFRAWVETFRAENATARPMVPESLLADDEPASPPAVVIFEVHRPNRPAELTHPSLVRLGGDERWTMWLCEG